MNQSNTRENKAIIANSNYLNNRDRVKSVASNQHLSGYNKANLLTKRDKSNESSKFSNHNDTPNTYQNR